MKILKLKHIIGPPIAYSLVFFFLYVRMYQLSDDHIFVSAFSTVFLVGMTLLIGLITFWWKYREKLGLIIGILLSFLLKYGYENNLLELPII